MNEYGDLISAPDKVNTGMTAEELKAKLDEFELHYTECGTLELVRTEKKKGEI